MHQRGAHPVLAGAAALGGILTEKFPFLHRLDSANGEGELVTTDHTALRSAIFLDGREQFWSERMLASSQELALVTNPEPVSFVFHSGFCGSTLLAGLLDAPEERFVLKEPQAISDLASQWPMLTGNGAPPPAIDSLDLVVGGLRSSAPLGEKLIVKPSCWANPLLPHLLGKAWIERAVFISLEWRAYLTACFRGGRDRLAYCAKLAELYAQHDETMNVDLKRVIAGGGDSLDTVARIVTLLRSQMLGAFEEAGRALGSDRALHCTLAEGSNAITAQASELARFFDPDGRAEMLQSDATELHAKAPSNRFDLAEQRNIDAEIERHHGARFDAARDWFARELPHRLSGEASP